MPVVPATQEAEVKTDRQILIYFAHSIGVQQCGTSVCLPLVDSMVDGIIVEMGVR
jgi:hypothetical protein